MSHVAIIAGINKKQSTNATAEASGARLDTGEFLPYLNRNDGLVGGTMRVTIMQDPYGNIFFISPNRRSDKIYLNPRASRPRASRVGFFADAPDPTNADSVPNTSYFDTQWTCQQWILWHKANVNKYGAPIANQKFVQYASQVSSLASDHFCPYESDFAAYFTQQGINFDNPLASLYVGTSNAASSAGTVITNASSGIASASSILTWLLPLALVGGAGYLGYEYLYKPTQRRTQMAGILKHKGKKHHGKKR